MDISWTSISRLKKSDMKADRTPVMTVAMRGVLVKGWMVARKLAHTRHYHSRNQVKAKGI
jgi:hypothetical protein